MPSPVVEHLRRSSDALLLLDDTDHVVHATPAARLVLRTDHLVGLDRTGLVRLLGTDGLDTDRSAGPRLLDGRSASGEKLDVLVLPSDMGLCLFVAPAPTRTGSSASSGTALVDKVLATVRDAVLVTLAEPIDAGGPIIVYANEALTRHTGYAVEELLGRSPRMLQGPGTDRAELDRLRESLEAWQPVTVELLNYRKDGSEFWVEIDIVPLADENGWFTHWVSVQRITSHRRRDDVEKERRRALVQAMLDSLPAQAALLDLRGRIVAVNQPWRDFWTRGSDGREPDWSKVNYLGVCRRSSELDDGQDGMDALAAYDGIRAVLDGSAEEFSLDYQCPIDGVVHWFTLQARPVQHGEAGVVVTHTDITDQRNSSAALTYLATHDPLTGLGNRRLFHQRVGDQLLDDRAHGTRSALVLLDIDRFRHFNQTYGPHNGDKVLLELARRLQGLVRQGDAVGRLGGDLFGLLLVRLPSDWSAEEFGDRLIQAVRRPFEIDGSTVETTSSAGIVWSAAHSGVDRALAAADGALLDAKRAGGDGWRLSASDDGQPGISGRPNR